MAITLGNVTYVNQIPSATTYTHSSHSQNTGTGGHMIVAVASVADFGQTISGVTWGGVAMTQLQQGTISTDGANTRLALYKLNAPLTGTQNLVVTWSGVMSYGVSIQIFSFTGAADGGNSKLGTPNSGGTTTETMSMSTNSIVIGVSTSRYSLGNIELPSGVARTITNTIQVYLAQVGTALSPSLALSGTQPFRALASQGLVSLSLAEIKEATAPVTTRRIFIV